MAELLPAERIVLGLRARDKDALLQALGRLAAMHGAPADPATIRDALRRREALGSTGLGGGFALPHASLTGLRDYLALFVRLARPVDFDAIDGAPVDLVCLLLTPADSTTHVTALAAIARPFRDGARVARIRAARDAAAVQAALEE